MFNFIRSFQSILQNACTTLHYHQQVYQWFQVLQVATYTTGGHTTASDLPAQGRQAPRFPQVTILVAPMH